MRKPTTVPAAASQWERLGVTLGRSTMASWMIKLGGTHIVPLINLHGRGLLCQRLETNASSRLIASRKIKDREHFFTVGKAPDIFSHQQPAQLVVLVVAGNIARC